ncbi:MAG: 4-(cytidine 5'-diphospho)-2-C-methyl-D-erythritol kinase, partial [Deltaproteobacteria bacterium]
MRSTIGRVNGEGENTVRLRAPAKVNLYLKILGVRPDGYHEIESLMAPVSLHDELVLSVTEKKGRVSISCPDYPELESPDNLACRAARAYIEESGWKAGLSITLTKRIPLAAGLGGGSSDAAAVLLGCDSMAPEPLGRERLHRIAASIGSDVPFFLLGRPALATGRGTSVEPVELPRLWLVLACAPFGHETARIYALTKQLTKVKAGGNKSHLVPPTLELGSGGTAELVNHLQVAGERRSPEIRRVRESLVEAGALAALMSGSGPSVLGVCE